MTEKERERRRKQREEALNGGQGAAPAAETIAEDTIEGVKAIAAFLEQPERRVFYLCVTKAIPAFRIGSRWHMRKSTYARFIERLEAEAIGRAS